MQTNLAAMQQAAHAVHTVEVTRSVRDAEVDGLRSRTATISGIVDGRVVGIGVVRGRGAAGARLASTPIADMEIVTIYFGAEPRSRSCRRGRRAHPRRSTPGWRSRWWRAVSRTTPTSSRSSDARVGVVTDSTADLSPEVQARLGLAMVPLIVNWDSQTFRDKIDLSRPISTRGCAPARRCPRRARRAWSPLRLPSASSSSSMMR